jgi:hypothetical protein
MFYLFFSLINFLAEVFPKSETAWGSEESLSGHAHKKPKLAFKLNGCEARTMIQKYQ